MANSRLKNRLAFTLLELLAVIVVLTIILAIAVPVIINIVNSVSDSAYESNLKMLRKSAMTYVDAGNIALPKDRDTRIDLSTLISKNYISEIRDPKNKNQICDGYVIVSYENTKYKYTPFLSCGDNYQTPGYNEVSVEPPIITLNGEETVLIGQGQVYIDAGASAYDVIDGDLTNKIITTSNINPDVLGVYQVYYTVKNGHNVEAMIVRTVKVIDTELPIITILNDYEIILNIGDIYVDAGATAYDYIDGDMTSNIIVINNVNTSKVGTYQVVYKVVDSSGNEALVTRDVKVVQSGIAKQLIDKGVVTSGDGLYKVEHYDYMGKIKPKYIYRGNPNNYVYFNNGLWRIVSVEADNTVKLIIDDNISTSKWSSKTSNKYETSTIKEHLNNYFNNDFNGISRALNKPKKLCIGDQYSSGSNTQLNAMNECSVVTNAEENIGLLYVSEYINASIYPSCNRLYASSSMSICKHNNYLFKEYDWWTMTASNGSTTHAWRISAAGDARNYSTASVYYVRPVVYIDSSAEIVSGNGTMESPYEIKRNDVVDKTSPIITVNGEKNITIFIGETYVDAGVTAIDDIDGNLSSKVTVTSDLNTNVSGTYQITYTVSDTSGNTATAIRTITVVSRIKLVSLKDKDITTSGDGIYEVQHYDNNYNLVTKYIYRGNPNNYLRFAGKVWRIISIEADGIAKIILDERIDDLTLAWNSKLNNNYEQSEIRTYLNNYYLEDSNFSTYDRSFVLPKKLCIGKQTSSTSNYNLNSSIECSTLTSTNEYIGLLQVNEYLNASLDTSCNRILASETLRICKNNNYLYKNYHWWSLTGNMTSDGYIWRISSEGDARNYASTQKYAVRPVLYINANLYISTGDGTVNNPYQITSD